MGAPFALRWQTATPPQIRKAETMQNERLLILLVEDNADHAELILRSFREHRLSNVIRLVSDGEAALDYLFRRGEYTNPAQSPRPHAILLDLRLPKLDGLEVLKEIKRAPELRHIPVVILTTSETPQDMAGAYGYHANSYLVKPVCFTKFKQLTNDLGYYWLGWNVHVWA